MRVLGLEIWTGKKNDDSETSRVGPGRGGILQCNFANSRAGRMPLGARVGGVGGGFLGENCGVGCKGKIGGKTDQ